MTPPVVPQDAYPERAEALSGAQLRIRKPDFFIVGEPKCGTTALYRYLKSHPQIFMPVIKEPQFFAESTISDPQAIHAFGEYMDLFAGATTEKRVGEASTAYLSSRCAPDRIKSFQPDARIIIMLRNPVDMMYALHGTLYYGGVETIASFASALAQDEREKSGAPRPSGRHLEPPYRAMAAYASQVERYFEVFGREWVHVILYDDFNAHTLKVVQDVLGFLGVSTNFEPRLPVVNPSREFRSQSVHRFLQNPPATVRRVIHALLPLPARRSIGEGLLRLNDRARPPIDAELRSRLVAEFEPEVARLSRVLGRDLSAWSVC